MSAFRGRSDTVGTVAVAGEDLRWATVVGERIGQDGQKQVLLRLLDGPAADAITSGVFPSVAPERVLVSATFELEHDQVGRRFYLRGLLLNLSRRSYRLLAFFVLHPQWLLEPGQLLQACWDESFEDPTASADERRLIQTAISRLRKSLGELGEILIQTQPGLGYRFNPDPLPV